MSDKKTSDPLTSRQGEESVKQEHAAEIEQGNANESMESSESLAREIGNQLKQARLDRGEKFDDLVKQLKLRKVYLQALEEGDWHALPDDVYAIGFLRQYAAHLNLDLEDEIQRMKRGHFKLTRPLTFPDPPIAPSRRWAWLSGIAFVVLFIAFNVFNQRSEDITPALQEPATPEQSVQTRPADTATTSTLHLQETKTLPVIDRPEASEPPATQTQQPPERTVTPPARPQLIIPLHTFRFDAVDDEVWLQVYLPDNAHHAKGELRKEVLLKAGQHFSLQEPVKSLWLTIGNAGALQISIDGAIVAAAGSIGKPGKVERDFKISAEQ